MLKENICAKVRTQQVLGDIQQVRYLRNESCLKASNRCASLNLQTSRARLKPSEAVAEAWKTRQVMSTRAT